MFTKTYDFTRAIGFCSCFGFTSKPKKRASNPNSCSTLSHESLFNEDIEEVDYGYHVETQIRNTRRQDDDDVICRQFPVKETYELVRAEDEDGNKVINEYVRERKIGYGSYGKVLLYRSRVDGKHYAMKAFHRPRLSKLRVSPSETAMGDVLREVRIMRMLQHPSIVNLVEVIDDPSKDKFYMVLEYVEGKLVWERFDQNNVLGEEIARKYLRDLVSGLKYLHDHSVVHCDIKPDNLLITQSGTLKIGDFGVSQVIEGDNDELRRSPGTPVFTAPECCSGQPHHGKVADAWAVGVTLYCMIFGRYPFIGETLQDTYDKIVSNPLTLPDDMNSELKNLIEGLLCKDPGQRATLDAVAEHVWVIGEDGPLPRYLCWCTRRSLPAEQ